MLPIEEMLNIFLISFFCHEGFFRTLADTDLLGGTASHEGGRIETLRQVEYQQEGPVLLLVPSTHLTLGNNKISAFPI